MTVPMQDLAERGNNEVAGSLLHAKMNRLQKDDERTLLLDGEIPVTMVPESTTAESTSHTLLPEGMTKPIGAKSSAASEAPTRKRPASTAPTIIGASAWKNRKLPLDAKTLPASDIVLPYDTGSDLDEHGEAKAEEYEDMAPVYGTPGNDSGEVQFLKVSKGSVKSSGRRGRDRYGKNKNVHEP